MQSELRDLLEYFGQEQACYTALLDLSRQQRKVIETGTIDALLQILGQKQQLLHKVGEIEQKLSPFKDNWRAIHDGLDENDRQVLDMALATVEELLAELIALEKDSEQLLSQRRDVSAVELKEAVQQKKAHQAYVGSGGEKRARALDVRNR